MLSRGCDSNHVVFHIENDRINQFKSIDCNHYNMISGHIRLFEANNYLDLEEFLRVTLVRDPFSQLISHINWMCYIGRFPRNLLYSKLPKSIRDLSIQMGRIDFKNLTAVERFFRNLPDIGYELFDNCQTKYLLNREIPAILKKEDAQMAINSLSFFDVVGKVESLDFFIDNLSSLVDWRIDDQIERKNVSRIRSGLDKKLFGLKEILHPFYSTDQIVYDFISGK